MTAGLRRVVPLLLFAAGSVVGASSVWLGQRLVATPPSPATPPAHWEATVFLPTQDNEGRPFAPADWDRALELLAVEGGGATLGGPQEGLWLDGRNRLHREPIRPVTVSFPRDRLEAFRAAVRAAGRQLGQEAMYVRLEEPRVEVLPVAGNE